MLHLRSASIATLADAAGSASWQCFLTQGALYPCSFTQQGRPFWADQSIAYPRAVLGIPCQAKQPMLPGPAVLSQALCQYVASTSISHTARPILVDPAALPSKCIQTWQHIFQWMYQLAGSVPAPPIFVVPCSTCRCAQMLRSVIGAQRKLSQATPSAGAPQSSTSFPYAAPPSGGYGGPTTAPAMAPAVSLFGPGPSVISAPAPAPMALSPRAVSESLMLPQSFVPFLPRPSYLPLHSATTCAACNLQTLHLLRPD